MPHFSIRLTAFCDCVVEADNEDMAMDIAVADAASGDYSFDTGEYCGEIADADLSSYLNACDFKSLAPKKRIGG